MNYLKQPDISKRSDISDLDLNSVNSVMNDRLISSTNSAAEETIPMQEKTRLYQPWKYELILKELYDLKDQQISQNFNSNHGTIKWNYNMNRNNI